MASTARRLRQRDPGAGSTAGTFWVDVECWDDLGGNVAASVSKGDPVIVHGTLTPDEWESEQGSRSKPRIKAAAVGPNLNKGRAMFTRDRFAPHHRPAAADAAEPRCRTTAPEQDAAVGRRTPGRPGLHRRRGGVRTQLDSDSPAKPAHA